MVPTIENVTIDKYNRRMEFDINNIDVAFLNAIRRVILSEIPNIAVYFDSSDIQNSGIIFHKNTSVLHNEFTGHRISLLPLCFDEKTINNFDPSNYKFVINESGEKIITTEHIKIYDTNDTLYDEDFHRKIFPPDNITQKFIIITKLKNENEMLHIEFFSTKDIAKKKGSGFCPVSQCCFYNNIDIKEVEKARANIKSPKDLNRFDTLDKYRYFFKNEYGEPSSFHFMIESECRLSPRYLFKKAIDILKEKLKNVLYNYKIDVINSDTNLYGIVVENENHTLGNIFQTCVFNEYVRPQKIVDFIGYYQPHPLVESIVFKIRFFKDINVESLHEFMREAVEKTINTLDTIPMDAFKGIRKQ